MTKDRLLAFSDGVIAILITIMVLELKQPKGGSWHDLHGVVSVLLAYILSFALVGIYWTNHHHMLAVVRGVSGGVLWANLHLLFWLSLIPFTTEWMSEQGFPRAPVAAYGIVMLGAAIAYFVLQAVLLRNEGPASPLSRAIGTDVKGKASVVVCVAGIAGSFLVPWLGLAFYVLLALLWFVPDRRVERVLVPDDSEVLD